MFCSTGTKILKEPFRFLSYQPKLLPTAHIQSVKLFLQIYITRISGILLMALGGFCVSPISPYQQQSLSYSPSLFQAVFFSLEQQEFIALLATHFCGFSIFSFSNKIENHCTDLSKICIRKFENKNLRCSKSDHHGL